MPEETTPPETEQAATEGFTNPDGTLVEGWQGRLSDESLREDKTLATIKDINTWAKNHVHLRRQVPLDKMPRPTENFTDSDWDEFYKAGGRPETPEDYGIKRHPDIPEEAFTDEMIKGYSEILHRNGAKQKLVDELVAYNDELFFSTKQDIDQRKEFDFNALKDGLVRKWGQAYDQKAHLGNIAIEKGMKGDLDFKARLIEKINKDPDLIEFASNMGSLFSEHGIAEDTNIPTPADHDTKIREAQGLNISDPAERAKHSYWNSKHPNHERQVKLVSQLIEAKSKKAS